MKRIIALVLSVFISMSFPISIYAQDTSSPETPVNINRIASRQVSKSSTQSIRYIGVTYTIKTTVNGTINYNSSGAAIGYSLDYYGTWINKPTEATIKYKDVSYRIDGANVVAHFTVGISVGGHTTWGLAKTLVL